MNVELGVARASQTNNADYGVRARSQPKAHEESRLGQALSSDSGFETRLRKALDGKALDGKALDGKVLDTGGETSFTASTRSGAVKGVLTHPSVPGAREAPRLPTTRHRS